MPFEVNVKPRVGDPYIASVTANANITTQAEAEAHVAVTNVHLVSVRGSIHAAEVVPKAAPAVTPDPAMK